MGRFSTTTSMVIAIALAGCQCGPGATLPDGGEELPDAGAPLDASVVILPPEVIPPRWPETFASEPCPPEAFGGLDAGVTEDGGYRFGICIVLRTLTADAFLDGAPEDKPVKVQFLAGGFESEASRVPDPQGVFQVKVMRSRYDIVQHQPGGVWPNFEGFIDHGFFDMTRDQTANFRATSHLLRGAVRFGGLAFLPSNFPQDVWFNAFGAPRWQESMVTSQGGSYELRLLEGSFSLYLSTPAVSLFGTELRNFNVTPTRNLDFRGDQEFDVEIDTSVLEAQVTIDGEPLPDARPGTDFSITYTKPGETDATVFSHHEGGLSGFTALLPKAQYGATLDFNGLPNPSLPTRIFGKSLMQSVDLRQDTSFAVDWSTVNVEGGIIIDGMPVRPNPSYNFQLYMFARANATTSSSFVMYEVPLNSSSFNLRVFPGLYFAVLSLDEGLAADLASGFWVIDQFFQVQGNRAMPITLDTAKFTGRITIDGQAPRAGNVGVFQFRNRAMQGQYSWFRKAVEVGEDGSFTVKLPKGEYEVYFTIDNSTYPEYASGRQLIFSRVPLEQDVVLDINYETEVISGPLRVGGEVVKDTIAGAEVGLRMQRQQDFQNFDWRFEGDQENYVIRVPKGSYALDFVIFENGIDGVAFGRAPMGLKLGVATPGEPFMNFGK